MDEVELATRLVRIEDGITAIRDLLSKEIDRAEKREQRLAAIEKKQARYDERLGLVAGALAMLQLVATAVAARLGR